MISFTPCLSTLGERTPCTESIGGWVGPRIGLDDVRRRKVTALPGLEFQPFGRPAVASRYTGHTLINTKEIHSVDCSP
jgi:hypothetical protein